MMRPVDQATARRLRAVLRAGDPAAALDVAATARSTIRARMRGAIAGAAPAASWSLRLAAGVALVALLAVVPWVVSRRRTSVEVESHPHAAQAPAAVDRSAEPPGAVAPRPTGERDRRQVMFETTGGTRIIWVLDPNLTL